MLDTVASVKPIKNADEDVIGRLEFSYAKHYVGGGLLRYVGTESYGYPFHNLAENNEDKDVSFISIDFTMIVLGLLALAGIFALGLFIHWVSPVVHMKRMRARDERRARKPRYTVIKNNGRNRRKRK